MQIELSRELEDLIRSKIASGEYRDPSAVIEEALRRLDEHDRMEKLRAAIAVGQEQASRGELIEWTPDFMDEVMREAEEDERLSLPIRDEVQP
jgi:antitoxin ParD1/3/4